MKKLDDYLKDYKIRFENDIETIFEKKKSNHISAYHFNKIDKSIVVSRTTKYDSFSKTITFEQLKSIIKICKELGWLDEEI